MSIVTPSPLLPDVGAKRVHAVHLAEHGAEWSEAAWDGLTDHARYEYGRRARRGTARERLIAKGRAWWANHDAEGDRVSVGPFRTYSDACTFRAMMFANPEYGSVDLAPDGYPMTVDRYRAAFRADLNTAKGSVPLGGWHP